MLKDELDAKTREYHKIQAKTQTQLSAKEKEKAKRVQKDAEYVWGALRKKFLKYHHNDQALTIYVGIVYNPNDPFTGHVHYKLFWQDLYMWLVFRKVKYIPETMDAIREMAEADGIEYSYEGYGPQVTLFSIVYATCFNLTYTPSEE